MAVDPARMRSTDARGGQDDNTERIQGGPNNKRQQAHHKRTKRNLLRWKRPKTLLLLLYYPLPFVPEKEHTTPNELELLDARW